MAERKSDPSHRVFIVGGGPGDPELLTLKAARLIGEADIIFYDKLVNTAVLSLARSGCELVFVGKEPGKACRSQEEINALLVRAARRKARVVRLKGGDPMVFGRGGEECLALREAGIAFEIVPGVTSAVAVAQYAGIPVTHRGVSCSFAVISGHETPDKDAPQVDWRAYARIDTLVVLMGVANRQQIARELLDSGRPADEPVAFVENGTTSSQKVLRCELGELAANPPEVRSPAVMIVGRVVELRDRLDWFSACCALPAPLALRPLAQTRAEPAQ